MSEPFVGEIRIFAGNFAPLGWAFCDGQLLAISQNDALFSLVGTTYGGDGRNTFALPDLRGRVPIHMGSGPGLTPRNIGSRGGSEQVTLTANQLPSHGHPIASSGASTSGTAVGNVFGNSSGVANVFAAGSGAATLAPEANVAVGGGQPHNNLMPTQCVNFIIALFGIYPSRS